MERPAFINPVANPDGGRPGGEQLDLLKEELTRARKNEASFRGMFENAVEGFFQTKPEGSYIRVNPALARIYGYESPADLISNISDIANMLYVRKGRREEFREILQSQGYVQDFESEIYKKDGRIIWISENARRVTDDQGEILYYEGTVVDITARKEAEAALRRSESLFRSLAETAGACIYILVDGMLVYINPATERLLGYTKNELLGRGGLEFVHDEDRSVVEERPCPTGEDSRETRTDTYRVVDREGRIYWMEDTTSIIDYHGSSAVLGIAIDVSDKKAAQDQLAHRAFHDSLTGLPNRALFLDRLDKAVQRAPRHPESGYAVLFLDLDRFKLINDSMGHQVGDELLCGIGRRLEGCLRASDTVARFGGDEFVILLTDVKDVLEANRVIDRIQSSLARPFHLGGQELFITGSIGVVLSTAGYDSAEDIIRDADIAMYRAKNQGRNRYEMFDSRMHSEAIRILQMENDLRRAIERREFVIHYQPIYCLAEEKLCSLEALVRWEHPVRGLISPMEFIPLAEETGLIVPIGQWVMREACRELSQLQRRQPAVFSEVNVCVNLSAKQLDQDDLVEEVRDTLRETSLEPRFLKLEITESVLMENAKAAINALERIKALGVQVAVDDFGTGYSSLSYLHRLPIDTLKVDRSFVSRMGFDPDNTEIVRTVIGLARSLGLDVVAEGVETPEQVAELKSLECQYVQGFHFCKPLPARDLVARMIPPGE